MCKAIFHTLMFIVFGLASIVIGFPLPFLLRLFDWSGNASEIIVHLTASWFVLLLGTRMKVSGLENIDKKKRYLIVSNHQSMMDILIMLHVHYSPFKFIAKTSLFLLPPTCFYMIWSNYIPVNRKKKTSAYRSMMRAVEVLKKKKASILIFPEGTRTLEPIVKKFKTGFLRIIEQAPVEILPVTINGSLEMKRKSSIWFYPTTINVVFHPPIPTEGITREGWDPLREQVENTIRTTYNTLQKQRTSQPSGTPSPQ